VGTGEVDQTPIGLNPFLPVPGWPACTALWFNGVVNKPRKFLTAEWRYLAMLNYEIDPALLLARVPAGTDLDSWHGKTFISIVGFLFLNTRVLGVPVPFHRDFEEVNLRFYVRREVGKELRRGVVFVKEIVPRSMIAAVARTVYSENYVAMPMSHRVDIADATDASGEVEYGWRTGGRWNRLRLKTSGGSAALRPGSQEEFITEHYWGYARQRDGRTVEYQVEHPPWRVWQTSEAVLECDVGEVYGDRFVEPLSSKPASAFLAEGSAITVRKGVRL